MTDIIQDLSEVVARIEDGDQLELAQEELYLLLSRAVGEIDRLRRANSDLGWQLNPDRMGGQFTDEELNRGNEWR
jgi:hypothetical protein